MANNSFIENVNKVANASALADSSIVEDTNIAANEAMDARDEAIAAANASADSEEFSRKWAENGFNNPVRGAAGIDAEYSSYHWSVVAQNKIGDPIINNDITSTNYTWSSSKIAASLLLKSDVGHLHDTLYEPKFGHEAWFLTKLRSNTTGNPTWDTETGNGALAAREDHNHSETYEPKRSYLGTAYNKDFGTTPNSVAEGDHLHDGTYYKIGSELSYNTAFNKNFDTRNNSLSGTSDEVSRRDHNHDAAEINYTVTNNGGETITATDVQGALTQVDETIQTFEQSEKTKANAASNSVATVDFETGNNLVQISGVLDTDATKNRNASITGAAIKINYPLDVVPSQKIEGWFEANITVDLDARDLTFYIGTKKDGSGVWNNYNPLSVYTRVDGTTTTREVPVSLSAHIGDLDNLDEIGVFVYSTVSGTMNINAFSMSWAGEGEGTIVISPSTFSHDLLTDRTIPDQHSIGAITGLEGALDAKIDDVPTAVDNNFALFNSFGKLKDSGVAIGTVGTKADKFAPATAGNIAVLDVNGNLLDGGKTVAQMAVLNGDSAETFSVAQATLSNHAVNLNQMQVLASSYATQADFLNHSTNTSNPHGVTYTQVGAAALVHTHVINDVIGLQDAINDKYSVLAGAQPEDNIAVFGSSDNTLKDSLTSINHRVLSGAETEDI